MRLRKDRAVKSSPKDNAGQTFMSLVYGLARSARAWRFACLTLAVCLVGSLFLYVSALRSMPVRLIPYDYAINQGIGEVRELGRVSNEYMSRLAIADASLFNNWTNKTVSVQYRRFLNRASPALYANLQIELINKAEEMSHGVRTRAFYPSDTVVEQGNVVEVVGRLQTYEGTELLENKLTRFRIQYRLLHGQPFIYSFEEKDYRS